ncbi:MAG TPA: OmpH family outer membrane protein [Geobacteraceae bacterium]|nr:OmpH family outer membrane protein [Geobacteraceae bacterium]
MKRTALLICITILSAVTFAVAADDIKLGTVDLPRIVRESAAGKKAAAEMKKLYDKYQTKITAREKELEKLKKNLVEKGNSLSPEQRAAKERELQKKFQAYQEFGKNAQEDVAKKEKGLLDPIMDGLEKLVKDYGRANGYAAIAVKGSIIYNDARYEAKDLSDEILKEFDAAGKPGGVSATSPPPPARTDALQGRMSSAGKPAGTDSGRK